MASDPEYDLTRQYKWGRMLERGEADRSPLDPDSIIPLRQENNRPSSGFGLVWFKYRAPVPKLPRHLPLDGGSYSHC